jgi:hypothetical protein
MFKISITVEIGLLHWLPFPNSHFHLFITLWSTTTHYFTGPNSRLFGTEVTSEITETLVSDLHWMGFHCHAAGSHHFTDHLFGHKNHNYDTTNSTIMKKWKWPFMNGCQCKCLICTVTKFLNSSQNWTYASMCLGIMLKYNENSVG